MAHHTQSKLCFLLRQFTQGIFLRFLSRSPMQRLPQVRLTSDDFCAVRMCVSSIVFLVYKLVVTVIAWTTENQGL